VKATRWSDRRRYGPYGPRPVAIATSRVGRRIPAALGEVAPRGAAADHGERLIIVSAEPTPYDEVIREPIGKALPEVLHQLRTDCD
jgi:hypothetical protein